MSIIQDYVSITRFWEINEIRVKHHTENMDRSQPFQFFNFGDDARLLNEAKTGMIGDGEDTTYVYFVWNELSDRERELLARNGYRSCPSSPTGLFPHPPLHQYPQRSPNGFTLQEHLEKIASGEYA